MKTIILAVVSDLHIGSTIGLCPPTITLDDGGTYRASKAQRWLWCKWQEYWKSIGELKEKYKAGVWIVSNGDLVDGNHHNTYQLWSKNTADWMRAADSVLSRDVIGDYEHIFITKGTDCHTGPSGVTEEIYGERIGAEVYEGNRASYVLPVEASGVSILFRHHGNLGQKEWTFANGVNGQAVEEILKKARGEHDADVVVQSHRHKFADSGLNYPSLRLIHTPAWQLRSAWGHSKPGLLSDIGGIAIVCNNGEYEVKVFIYKPVKMKVWKEANGDN
jgi:hypothetical protein